MLFRYETQEMGWFQGVVAIRRDLSGSCEKKQDAISPIRTKERTIQKRAGRESGWGGETGRGID